MGELVMLSPYERTQKDIERLVRKSDLRAAEQGAAAWDATIENLADALCRVALGLRAHDLPEVEDAALAVAEQAHELGLNRLFRVCRHVVALSDGSDRAALAANVARLVRLGDEAVGAAWRYHDAQY